MNQQQLITNARRDHGITLEALGDLFGCTKQHISQIVSGKSSLSVERILILATNSDAPKWSRDLAFQLWMDIMTTNYAQMGAQLEELRGLLFPNGNGKAHQ